MKWIISIFSPLIFTVYSLAPPLPPDLITCYNEDEKSLCASDMSFKFLYIGL